MERLLAGFRRYLLHNPTDSGRIRAAGTIEKYVNRVAFLMEFFDTLTMTREDAETFLELLSKSSQSTINGYLAAFNVYFEFLVAKGKREDNPFEGFRYRAAKNRLPEVRTAEEIEKIIENIRRRNDPSKDQDELFVEIAFGSGLRRSEIGSLTLSNIIAPEIIQVTGKGDKEGRTILSRAAYVKLRSFILDRFANDVEVQRILREAPKSVALDSAFFHLVETRPDEAIFYTEAGTPCTALKDPGAYVYKRIKAVCEFAPHTLRHSFATELLYNGADIYEVKEALRHSKISTTEIYLHVSNRTLKKLAVKHPRSGV